MLHDLAIKSGLIEVEKVLDVLTPATLQHWIEWQRQQWRLQAERDKKQNDIYEILKVMIRK